MSVDPNQAIPADRSAGPKARTDFGQIFIQSALQICPEIRRSDGQWNYLAMKCVGHFFSIFLVDYE
jgi:hypothetical protein